MGGRGAPFSRDSWWRAWRGDRSPAPEGLPGRIQAPTLEPGLPPKAPSVDRLVAALPSAEDRIRDLLPGE